MTTLPAVARALRQSGDEGDEVLSTTRPRHAIGWGGLLRCAVTGAVPQINTCPEVGEVYQRGVKNIGAEVELAWRPIDGLELKGAVTVQDPKITNANYKITREVRDSANVLTGYEYVEIGEDGRRPRRLPTVMVNFTPSFDFRPLTGVPVSVFGQFYYYSSRFSEAWARRGPGS